MFPLRLFDHLMPARGIGMPSFKAAVSQSSQAGIGESCVSTARIIA